MYRDFPQYLTIYTSWKKQPKKHILDVLMKNARGLQCMGVGCFGITCLCCCCNGSSMFCGMSDIGSHWSKAMKTYQYVDPKKMDALFEKAILLLQDIEQRYKAALETMEKEVKHQLDHGTMDSYQQWRFQHTLMRVSIGGAAWLSTLIEAIYHNLLGRSTTIKYVSLTGEEIDILEKCLPLFYPATQKADVKVVSPMDAKVLHVLRDRLITA